MYLQNHTLINAFDMMNSFIQTALSVKPTEKTALFDTVQILYASQQLSIPNVVFVPSPKSALDYFYGSTVKPMHLQCEHRDDVKKWERLFMANVLHELGGMARFPFLSMLQQRLSGHPCLYLLNHAWGSFDVAQLLPYKLEGWNRTTENALINICGCGMAIFTTETAVISERPVLINRNDKNQLHCTDGPALRYHDFFEVYAVNGVVVDQVMIENKPLITQKMIDAEPCHEQKRAMMDLMWEVKNT